MSDLDQALSVARVHLKAGRLGEAAAIHFMLSALRPNDPEGWYRLGHALVELGEEAYAAACFREALRHLPGHPGAAHELTRAVDGKLERAAAELAAGNRAEAILALGAATLLDPADQRPQLALRRHALASMPEAAALPSIADQPAAYRRELMRREFVLGRIDLDAGAAAAANTRFGRLAALATEAEAEMRRIGLTGQQMTAAPRPMTPHIGDTAPLISEARRLADGGRLEEAILCARRALASGNEMEASRDLLHRLRTQLTSPGPRIMPGIGKVDLHILKDIWRYVPAQPERMALAISIPYIPCLDPEDVLLDNHGPWEVRQVVRSLLAAGFVVDVTQNTGPALPDPVPDYDLAYSLHGLIALIADRLPARTLKVLWLTGSNPGYNNRRELERIAALEKRGRTGYRACRQCDATNDLIALGLADRCVILGNEHTGSTFDAEHRAKMTRLMPTSSRLMPVPPVTACDGQPEFLWLGGGGAVLKGLDLILEAFAEMPELTLHVVGFPAEEPEFDRLYETELYRLGNVRLHGFLRPSGPEFAAILARSSVVIAPSASEGASTSVATCLAAGLFPIVSDDTGLDYGEGLSIRLSEMSVEAIMRAVRAVTAMPPARLAALRGAIRAKAEPLFSRARFAADVDALVQDWIKAIR
jgi:glycosyltransferase involved in cell wall biosynthesis